PAGPRRRDGTTAGPQPARRAYEREFSRFRFLPGRGLRAVRAADVRWPRTIAASHRWRDARAAPLPGATAGTAGQSQTVASGGGGVPALRPAGAVHRAGGRRVFHLSRPRYREGAAG